MQYSIRKHELDFITPAKTSRNVFKKRTIYLVELVDKVNKKRGLGEAAPLSILSIDDVNNYEQILDQKLQEYCEIENLNDMDLNAFPSIRFGMETAILSLSADDRGRMYSTPFTAGKTTIPVNGLVWMNDAETMYAEAMRKIQSGFEVIKFKVGALDFDEECRLLEKIRKQYSAFKVTLRLDANGGFLASDAQEKLKELSRFEIHSVEQPIAVNQWDDMNRLCREGKIRIALDEELIGINVNEKGPTLLDHIQPQYLILKPNLIGGVSVADQWIRQAEKRSIQWWATSALEGNVGLSAIAQWVSQYDTSLAQGLGTGALYSNNLKTQLRLENGQMSYSLD